jgi:hypothetical protein
VPFFPEDEGSRFLCNVGEHCHVVYVWL